MLKESRDGIELVAMVGCRLDFLMVVSTKVSLALSAFCSGGSMFHCSKSRRRAVFRPQSKRQRNNGNICSLTPHHHTVSAYNTTEAKHEDRPSACRPAVPSIARLRGKPSTSRVLMELTSHIDFLGNTWNTSIEQQKQC
jgi:hypothetical protein